MQGMGATSNLGHTEESEKHESEKRLIKGHVPWGKENLFNSQQELLQNVRSDRQTGIRGGTAFGIKQ